MTEDETKALINQGLNALHAKIQDDLAVIRNTAAVNSIITNRLLSLYPGDFGELARQIHLDCEHAIGDVLTRGFPEGIASRHQAELEALQAYLAALAQARAQGTGEAS